MIEVLFTPANSIQIINKVKDSKFYGSISRADNEKEVKAFINRIKKDFHDATHNISAYILGIGDDMKKYADDDGEPAGSSGPPVLQAIEGAGLTNTVIVVTRYFGGTKLGIGGLIRAYGETAKLVIDEARVKKLRLFYKFEILGNYNNLGTIMGQIEAFQGEIIAVNYSNDGAVVSLLIIPSQYKAIKKCLIEKTGANVEFKLIDKIYK